MTREQYLAFINSMLDMEEASRANEKQMMMEKMHHYQEMKRLMREQEDINDAKNFICDMAGVPRVAPSFHKISDDYRPLDVVYADNHGIKYNDGLADTALGRAVSAFANVTGLSRAFVDRYRRI